MKRKITALTLVGLLPAIAVFAEEEGRFAKQVQNTPHETLSQLTQTPDWANNSNWMGYSDDDDDEGNESHKRRGHDDDDEHEGGDDDDDGGSSRNNPARAGTVAPPTNGLFNNGTVPKVKVN